MEHIGTYSTEESQSLSESLTHIQKHQSLRSDSLLLKEQNVPSMHTQLRIATNNKKKRGVHEWPHRPPWWSGAAGCQSPWLRPSQAGCLTRQHRSGLKRWMIGSVVYLGLGFQDRGGASCLDKMWEYGSYLL